MGAAGIRYRHFVQHARPTDSSPCLIPNEPVAWEVSDSHGPFEVLEKQGVIALSDSDSEALLKALNEHQRKVIPAWLTWVVTLGLLTFGFIIFPVNLLMLAGWLFLNYWLKKRATLTLWYDLDSRAEANWDSVRNAVLGLGQANVLWHLTSKAQVHDARYHAGAGHLINRERATVREEKPPLVKANIMPVVLFAGSRALYFFPDRIFVYEAKSIGGVGYPSLQPAADTTRMIEEERIPADAQVVGHTWKYVNKNGTPDRRFANNRQIPVCAYESLELCSNTGLNQQFQISRQGLGQPLVRALQMTARQIPAEVTASQLPCSPRGNNRWDAEQRQVRRQQPPSLPKFDNMRRTEPQSLTSTPPPLPIRAKRPVTRQSPLLQWVPRDQPVSFNGITIPDGMIYWSQGADSYEEPSAIDLSKSLATLSAPCDEELGYWPNYAALNPTQRRCYVNWLAQQRRDADPSQRALGYLFLFFYGLERRICVEGDSDPGLIDEILRLLQFYGAAHPSSRSLRSYFLGLAHNGGWRLGHESYRGIWPRTMDFDEGRTGEEPMKLVLANLLELGEPMHWSIAYRLALTNPDCRRSVVMTRAQEEFWKLFQGRYEGEYGAGLMLQASKQACWYRYQPASAALLAKVPYGKRSPLEFKVPNVLGYPAQFRHISELWNSCLDDLSGYSRALASKKNADPSGLRRWLALPKELRSCEPNPMQPFWDWVTTVAPREGDFAFVSIASLGAWFGLEERAKLTTRQSTALASDLADMGWVIAPHAEHTGVPYHWSQAVAVYQHPGDQSFGQQLLGVARLLFLVMPIASADGAVEPEEMDAFHQFIGGELQSEEDWKYLRAIESALMRDSNVATRSLSLIARNVPAANRESVMHLLVNVAAADGEVSPEEMKLLRRLTRTFGLDPDTPERILRDDASHSAVVIVERKTDQSSGETIPPKPAAAPAGLVLDADRIAALTQETHEVVAMLSEVMKEDRTTQEEVSKLQVSAASIVLDGNEWMAELDPRFHDFVLQLRKNDEMPMKEFESLVDAHHLLVEDAFDSINAWSDEVLGDFLLDRGDPVSIHRNLFPTLPDVIT